MTTNLRQDVDFSSLIKKLGTSMTAGKHAEKDLYLTKKGHHLFTKEAYTIVALRIFYLLLE